MALDLLATFTVALLLGLHYSSGFPTDVDSFLPLSDSSEDNPALDDSPLSLPAPEEELDELAKFLSELLIEDPWQDMGDPLVYISEDESNEGDEAVPVPWKRSRYYRRYPWKRQNGRKYDPDGYICNPSKDDVFQLLVALHDAKNGKDRTVYFCNRRRPARAIFSNIRFLGRRK